MNPPSLTETGWSALWQFGAIRSAPQRQLTVVQRSKHVPKLLHGSEDGLEQEPRRPHLLSMALDCNGLLRFSARPLTDTLCTQPTKSSEWICSGRSSIGSALLSPPINNG